MRRSESSPGPVDLEFSKELFCRHCSLTTLLEVLQRLVLPVRIVERRVEFLQECRPSVRQGKDSLLRCTLDVVLRPRRRSLVLEVRKR